MIRLDERNQKYALVGAGVATGLLIAWYLNGKMTPSKQARKSTVTKKEGVEASIQYTNSPINDGENMCVTLAVASHVEQPLDITLELFANKNPVDQKVISLSPKQARHVCLNWDTEEFPLDNIEDEMYNIGVKVMPHEESIPTEYAGSESQVPKNRPMNTL